MGSIFLARPMFDRIKQKYPGASIYALLFKQNREALEILNSIPSNNILTVRNTSLITILVDSIRCLLRMRHVKIDTVIDCELFSRISSIYSFLSGAKIRAGFHPYTQEGLFRGDFINRPVLYNPYHHISHQFITLVEALESGMVPTVKRKVPVADFKVKPIDFRKEEIEEMIKRIHQDFHATPGKKLVLIYPGGGLLPIRAWPKEYFSQTARELVQSGYNVGIIGMGNDKKLAGEILSFCNHKNCIDLTGYTKSIRELMLLFHCSSLLITNDGGPGHFASATPIPAIILYGPETPALYGSLSPKAYNFYIPLSCSPCLTAYNHRNSPCDGDNRCLKFIKPGDVLKKAYEILQRENNSNYLPEADK